MIGSITLNKKKYPFVFNINTQRVISRKKGFSKLSEFEKWFGQLSIELGNGDVNLDDWDDICIVLISGITVGCRKTDQEDPNFTIDDMSELIIENQNAITEAFTTVIESTQRDVKPKKGAPRGAKTS